MVQHEGLDRIGTMVRFQHSPKSTLSPVRWHAATRRQATRDRIKGQAA
jgi:hypothetical protein